MKRILTGIVLVVLVVALILFGKMWMITALAALIAALAAIEFRSFAEAGGCPIPMWWTLGSIALFFLATFYRPQDTITAVSLCTLVLFVYSAFRTSIERVLWQTAAGLLMLVYIAFPLTLIPQILSQDNGTAILLFLFLCVWCGDIAALYIGKRFGRHKLAPTLSPNKTWEGSIASIVGSIAFGMALIGAGEYLSYIGSSFTKLHTTEPWWVYVALAAGLNIAASSATCSNPPSSAAPASKTPAPSSPATAASSTASTPSYSPPPSSGSSSPSANTSPWAACSCTIFHLVFHPVGICMSQTEAT